MPHILILSNSELTAINSVLNEKLIKLSKQPKRLCHRFIMSIDKKVQSILFPPIKH